MNIQDKIIRHNKKQQKTTESKRAELSGPEAKRVEYEQETKPKLSDQERKIVEKYFQKLSPLNFGEYDTYQLVKKYEWNEKALDEVSNEKLRYKEEGSHGDGWTEIKKTEKPLPTTNDRNPKEGQKQRRNQKNADQPAENNDQRPNYKNRQQDRRRGDNEQRQDNQEHDQEYYENRNYNQNRRADREYYQPKRNNQNRRNNYNQEPREDNQNRRNNDNHEPKEDTQQTQEPRTEENVNERKESHSQQQQQQQDNKRAGGKRNNQKYNNKSSNSPIYGKRGGYEQFEYVRKEVPTPTVEKKPEESQQQQATAPAQTEQTKPSVPQERKVNPKINEPQPTPSDSRATETKHKEEKKEHIAHPAKQTPVKAHKEQHQEAGHHQTSSKKQEKQEAPVQTQPVSHPVNQQANTSPIPQQPSFGAPIVLPSMPSGPQFILPQTVDVKPLFPYPYTVFPLPNGTCHIVPFYLMMPPMMQMFPPQFQGVPQTQPQTQGNQSNQDPHQISQHQMSSFFSFPDNRKN